MAEQDIESD